MGAGLWWIVRSGPALDVETLDVGRGRPGSNGYAQRVLGHRTAALDRRAEHRLRLYLVARDQKIRSGQWFRPWCLSRAKRLADLVGATLLLLLASPVMVAIAVATRIDSPGPVLFRQWRTGFAGRRFRMYKFRTMRAGAEHEKETLLALNHHGPGSIDFKIRNDPRVTRLGGFLRRTSLDELPNLFNVVRGEMSLVGPRPTSFGIEVYQDSHLARLVVPPGLTGLWQVSGRSEIDFDLRVELDCRYIREQSPLLDAQLLVRTVARVFDGRGAC